MFDWRMFMSNQLKKLSEQCSKNYRDYVESMSDFPYAPSIPTKWGFNKESSWSEQSRCYITQPGFFTPFEPASLHDHIITMSAKQAGITMAVLAGRGIVAPLYHFIWTFGEIFHAIMVPNHARALLANAGKHFVQIASMPPFYAIELIKEVFAFMIRSAITYVPPVVTGVKQCVSRFFTNKNSDTTIQTETDSSLHHEAQLKRCS